MVRHGYLNLGLIYGGLVKKTSTVESSTPMQIATAVNKMVINCPWSRCSIPRTFSRWSKETGRMRPNWYLPVHLGGYGLDITLAPPIWRVTKEQRILAARFVSDPTLALVRSYGDGKTLTKEIVGAMCEWRWEKEFGPLNKNTSDDWLIRLALATQMSRSGIAQGADPLNITWQKLRRDYRLKPMSNDGFQKYWLARVVASTVLPYCPPLLPLRRGLDSVISWDSRHFRRIHEAAERNLFVQQTFGSPYTGLLYQELGSGEYYMA